jgi:hypothetical protein
MHHKGTKNTKEAGPTKQLSTQPARPGMTLPAGQELTNLVTAHAASTNEPFVSFVSLWFS